MLLIRMDEAVKIVDAARTLRNKLVIRYMLFVGLEPREVGEARIEHIDPMERTIYIPRRHWYKDGYPCVDRETLYLTAEYIGSRKKGPLIRAKHGGHLGRVTIWKIVKKAAARSGVRCADKIQPRTLKYIFATTWLKPKPVPFLVRCPSCERVFQIFIPLPGSVGTLQKQLSHKHLSSTAHYLKFIMDDVRPEYERLMRHVHHIQAGSLPIDSTFNKKEVVEWVDTRTLMSSAQRYVNWSGALSFLRNLET